MLKRDCQVPALLLLLIAVGACNPGTGGVILETPSDRVQESAKRSFPETETWEVEIPEPPPHDRLIVFIQPRSAGRGMPMRPVEGQPFRYRAEVPRGSSAAFSIHVENGTWECGGRCYPEPSAYCGPLRAFTDRETPGKLKETRLVYSAIMSNPLGETGYRGCGPGSETIAVDQGKWRPLTCVYQDTSSAVVPWVDEPH